MSESLVIIPTYNEKENIPQMIRKVLELPGGFDLLIVDDSSPDGTAQLVEDMIPSSNGRLFIEVRKGKLGLGTAYIHGFRWALSKDYQYIFEMDADFSHDPENLKDLLMACKEGGADLAIGSRYTRGGKVENWPMRRILMSYFASVYVRLVTWMPVKDTTAGFVCYRRKVLETIDLSKIKFVGYAFQIEMKFATWLLRFRIKEVPITFTDRVVGVSKMSKSIFKEAVLGVLKMKLQSFFKSYGKKAKLFN